LNVFRSASNSNRDVKKERNEQKQVEAIEEIDFHVEADIHVAEGNEYIGILGHHVNNGPVINPSINYKWKGEAHALIEVYQVLLIVILSLLVYRLLLFIANAIILIII
jgi:hypothetical protein